VLELFLIVKLWLLSSVQYCLIEMNGGVRTFRVPTLEDVLKHRVIVVTLSISMYLSTLGLQKGLYSALYTYTLLNCKLFVAFSDLIILQSGSSMWPFYDSRLFLSLHFLQRRWKFSVSVSVFWISNLTYNWFKGYILMNFYILLLINRWKC
jgi:hypothetical protein